MGGKGPGGTGGMCWMGGEGAWWREKAGIDGVGLDIGYDMICCII